MEFEIRKAGLEDAQVIADVIQEVFLGMEHKEWYVADNADYTREMLRTGKGMVYKAVEKGSGQLAGVLMITFPGLAQENLGNDIGFSEEQLLRTAHMESAAVLPQYRGNRLQYLLMQSAEKEAAERGYGYLMCTIHPENRYSKENALRQGYQVMKTKEKYGGLLRDILLKKLPQTPKDE